jgi:L-methionine (R)-S-oxide reductase
MHTAMPASSTPDYPMLSRQVSSILDGERDLTANAAQFSAFVFESVANLNWAGFYLMRPNKLRTGEELLVGPFQGKVACARIPLSRGVCGAAARERLTMVVNDVHAFADHIACDANSNAEIVIPLIKDGHLYGVFDIDSPITNRFSEEDRVGLEAMVAAFLSATDMA